MKSLAYYLLTGFLIAGIAFVNGYPLIYSDSGSYIWNAFSLVPSVDRPIGYGFIIRAVTWQSTLWTVVVFQGAMTSWLVHATLRILLPVGTAVWRVHLPIIVVLMLVSSMPWYVAQIMPDVFSALLPLVLFLLFQERPGRPTRRIFLWICAYFFIFTHYSHVAMVALLLAGMALWVLVDRRTKRDHRFWRTWTGVAACTMGVVLFASWYNGRHGFRPVFSPSANVFFTGRLCEGKVMHDFLVRHCDRTNYPLCPYKDDLPQMPSGFIWGDDAIMHRMGLDIATADTILAPLVHDLLRDPRSLGMYLRTAVIGSTRQLFLLNTGSGIISYRTESAPFWAIDRFLKQEMDAFQTALQAYNGWDFQFINRVVYVFMLLAVLVVALLWHRVRADPALFRFAMMMIAWIVFNAMITASLANIYDRLQARVTWLLVFVALVLLARSSWGKRLVERISTAE